MSNTNKTMIEYIVKKLDVMDEKLDKVHEQALLTNGRVTTLEKSSAGFWARNNVVKFSFIVAVLMAVLISDIRHPAWTLIKTLFI